MRFADFHAGQEIVGGPRVVTEQDILAFAQSFDPQAFHLDAGVANAGPFNGLISSGWHTCSIAMRLVVDAALIGSESSGSPGLAYVRWPHPVRPGDALSLRATVLETRRSSRQPTLGILRWRWQLFNKERIEVLDLEATSFFDLSCIPTK